MLIIVKITCMHAAMVYHTINDHSLLSMLIEGLHGNSMTMQYVGLLKSAGLKHEVVSHQGHAWSRGTIIYRPTINSNNYYPFFLYCSTI